MNNVLVLFETNPVFRQELTKILSGYRIIFNEGSSTRSIDEETAGNIAIIFGNPHIDLLKRCHRLEWLQLKTAGANQYVNGALKQTVMLTCATGSYGLAVSEHMVGLTFELFKKLHLYRDEQSHGRWQNRGTVKSIQGAKILVVGLGDIGAGYARRMKALGAYIIGVRRTAHSKQPCYVDELFPVEQLDKAIPQADVIALAVPETKETIGLINRPRLEKMKKEAVIINAGRGSAIDTEALCDALEAGVLGGAGLDVTDPEPLPPGHRLWKLENAVITPHISGGANLPETVQYILRLCLENASRFVKGQALKSRINYETGYCFSEDFTQE